MGYAFSKLLSLVWWGPEEIKLVIVGLDNAGKVNEFGPQSNPPLPPSRVVLTSIVWPVLRVCTDNGTVQDAAERSGRDDADDWLQRGGVPLQGKNGASF